MSLEARATGGGATAVTGDVVRQDDVVLRAQEGDVDAFETLYRTHAPAVHALCRRMVGDEREARELVQDVFVRAWERLTSFRGQSALGTWLHRLAVNVVLERLRSARREALRTVDGGDDDDRFTARAAPSDADARMDLDAALARLPDGARTVFVLHDVQGYQHEEIAEMTGIAAATSRVQLWRARRALTRLLDP
jgi:RNA polymerase sigma-70 factor (ECF subfamily)